MDVPTLILEEKYSFQREIKRHVRRQVISKRRNYSILILPFPTGYSLAHVQSLSNCVNVLRLLFKKSEETFYSQM